ncbi:hypothetical protein ARALYDRAFT_915553 [Arabidopsis lyrata subsp. lyrata]|uniref:Uncharacterized protein n=1 Tax=Arabidopsis lyrata subsp. lyrata TaxID=81972 RepID=D7MHE0_ARALL|nr:hypothetical protein ARALYDRAFT_915553 [Arabidopsis lyrata subsp. lyrata]
MSTPKSGGDPLQHPTKEQLTDISYCITSPHPWPSYLVNARLRVIFQLRLFCLEQPITQMRWICGLLAAFLVLLSNCASLSHDGSLVVGGFFDSSIEENE